MDGAGRDVGRAARCPSERVARQDRNEKCGLSALNSPDTGAAPLWRPLRGWLFLLCVVSCARRPKAVHIGDRPHRPTTSIRPTTDTSTRHFHRASRLRGAMKAKCLAIAHAELGGSVVQRVAHRRPHLVENRTMTSKYDQQPPR
eukprot:scaffold74371_cov69-Phaeocystis_antarctica.AAC.3